VQGRLLTKQPALRRLRHLCSACRSPGASPWTPGRLRRPWETSNSPKPARGFQPEKGRFRPPLSSPLAGSSFATPPAPPGSLSVWDQRGAFPSLDTPRQGPLAVYPCTLSGVWGGKRKIELGGREQRPTIAASGIAARPLSKSGPELILPISDILEGG
jgi:hypothetical protein